MDNTPISTPAKRLIDRFGAQTLSQWTGRHITRVYAWAWSTDRGGTGGHIPVRARRAIVDGARRDLGISVEWSEFEPMEGETYLIDGAAA